MVQPEKAVIKGRLGTLTLESVSIFAHEVVELQIKLMEVMEAEECEIHPSTERSFSEAYRQVHGPDVSL